MTLSRKLQQWRAAGLIDEATAERIAEHEASRSRPIAAWALAGLGATTVGIGTVSVVAANWDGIPDAVKLGVDLAIASALAAGIALSVRRGSAWGRDVLALVYYLFTVASIALVGQVYQLGTPTWVALVYWTLSTAPLLLVAERGFVAVVGAVGLVVTHGHLVEAAARWQLLSRMASSDDVALGLILGAPMVYAGIAAIPWLVRERPAAAAVLRATAWTGVLLGGALAGFLWYDDLRSSEVLSAGHLGGVASVLAFASLVRRLHPGASVQVHRVMVAVWAAAWVIVLAATTFPREDIELLAPVSHLAFLALVAWLAVLRGQSRVFQLCTALAALRILVAYFEVFGSMLDTGIAMITGGGLTIALAWVWRKKTETLARALTSAARGGPPHG